MDVPTRVRQLIALAAREENEEAARSAALQACRLIARHGLVLQLPPVVAAEPSSANVSGRPSARVRVPFKVNHKKVKDVGRFVADLAQEAASRVTVADVVEVAVAIAGRRR